VVGVWIIYSSTTIRDRFFYRYRHTKLVIQEVVQWECSVCICKERRVPMRHEIHFSAAGLCDGISALWLNIGQRNEQLRCLMELCPAT
jgi:hypothetical protein